jgi:membrane protease subunit HflC
MKHISDGETEVRRITFKANTEFNQIKTAAEITATEMKRIADLKAYDAYEEFKKNPELAEFLSKIETLKKMGGPGTTVFIDTSMPPFDLLKSNAIQLKQTPAAIPAKP